MRCVIHRCATSVDLISKAWNGRPQQGHCTGDVRRRHRRAAANNITTIARITGRADTSSRSADIRLYPAASIDCDGPATAEVPNDVMTSAV